MLHTYILGFVALEAPRAPARTATAEFVHRLSAFFRRVAGGAVPHSVELARLLPASSSDDRLEFGLRTFLAGLVAQQSGIVGSPIHDAAPISAHDGP